MVDPFLPDQEKLAAVREALPATAAGIYLDTATCGPLPAEAAAAMRQLEDWEVRVGRADEGSLEALGERADEARGVLAALLGGDPRQIVLVHSVVEGLAAVLADVSDTSLGGPLLMTDQEPASTQALLRGRADRDGLRLETLPAGPDVPEAEVLAGLERGLADGPRLALVSHVLPTTGRVMPVAAIAERCRQAGVALVVDGSQAAGALPLEVPGLGVAAYLVPGHAWLLGPEGVGAVWLDPGGWPDGSPGLGSPGPGDFHRPSLAGFARAVGWLEMYVGLPWALDRGRRLAEDTADRLAQLPGVALLTPRDRMATIVSFRIEGWSASRIREELGRRSFAIVGRVPALDAVRLSIGWFNAEDELERLVGAVAELAEAGPEAPPRRPTLVVLGEGAAGSSAEPPA